MHWEGEGALMWRVLYKAFNNGRQRWDQESFRTRKEAITFADSKMRAGWMRDEIDVQDESGSVNVRLPTY